MSKDNLPYLSKLVKVIVIMSVLVIMSSGFGRLAAADNNWYVGQGAKANMYVTYKIQNHDTNQGGVIYNDYIF